VSLRRRLFLTLCLIVLTGFFGIARWIQGELRNSYGQVVEEILVDYAHVAAAHLENHRMSKEGLKSLTDLFAQYRTHKINAKIFDFVKQDATLEFYVTDTLGKVVAANRPELIGQDYSKWNDVYKTLRDEYGVRSTHLVADDPRTSVYFIAAPVKIDGKIEGVATIYKAEGSVLLFLDRALNKMFMGGLFSVVALGLLGGLIMLWITLPLEKLRKYALEVSEGQRGELPHSKIKEVKHLSEAFEKMRISLEGKKTVEKYTQALTHELKSPLTAIKGAAELCLEEMDHGQQKKFINNIIEEANRSHALLEQLLKIAAIESRTKLEGAESFDFVEILNETKEALMGLWRPKNIEVRISAPQEACTVRGDRLLLFQSVRNLLQNSIEFSPASSVIELTATCKNDEIGVQVKDSGTGIPEFAKTRIFEKFYSLERPDTKKKSSGLGLSFVKEVIELHQGTITVESPNQNGSGTTVTVKLPVKP
jgi:two-component system sensor histidine kinase CreC